MAHLSNAGSKSLTPVIVVALKALNVAPVWIISVSEWSQFFNFRHASRPWLPLPLTMDRGSPAVCTRMPACKASLSAASMMCALVVAAASIALSRHRFAPCRDACLSGSENSSDVVAPVVVSVSSELLDPDLFSCEELLLLRLLLLSLLLCKPLQVSLPLHVPVHMRCYRCHGLLFCHATGALCCCYGPCGR